MAVRYQETEFGDSHLWSSCRLHLTRRATARRIPRKYRISCRTNKDVGVGKTDTSTAKKSKSRMYESRNSSTDRSSFQCFSRPYLSLRPWKFLRRNRKTYRRFELRKSQEEPGCPLRSKSPEGRPPPNLSQSALIASTSSLAKERALRMKLDDCRLALSVHGFPSYHAVPCVRNVSMGDSCVISRRANSMDGMG